MYTFRLFLGTSHLCLLPSLAAPKLPKPNPRHLVGQKGTFPRGLWVQVNSWRERGGLPGRVERRRVIGGLGGGLRLENRAGLARLEAQFAQRPMGEASGIHWLRPSFPLDTAI